MSKIFIAKHLAITFIFYWDIIKHDEYDEAISRDNARAF